MKEGSGESGFIRISPRASGAAVILSLIVVGAVTGMLLKAPSPKPNDLSQKPNQRRAADSESGSVISNSCSLCGTIESIWTVEVRDEVRPISAGSGGFTGTVSNADKGDTGVVTTLLGAVGGAFTGSEMDERKRRVYRVTVRMDDGSFRTVSLSNPPTFTVGEKVRVVEGKLVRA
jgi:outer membrane lipoprotein SlyB